MAYAVVGYFDRVTDSFIKTLWKELAENNICEYLYNSENNPHVKFAMYKELDVKMGESLLFDLTKRHFKQNVHFKNYGFFSNEMPTVFIDISPTVSLIELQKDIRIEFGKCSNNFDFDYFNEGIWMPSCPLTVKNEAPKIHDAIQLLLDKPLQFNGRLERLGIIEFHPAKQIISYSFVDGENNLKSKMKKYI